MRVFLQQLLFCCSQFLITNVMLFVALMEIIKKQEVEG